MLKSKEQEREQQEDVHNRMLLLSAAKSGDPQAIESLTLDDIDTYSKVSRRLISEDVFTIVDTYIMPYGIECDRYSIMGEILEYRPTRNEITREDICIMKLDVNGLLFDVCVPKRGHGGTGSRTQIQRKCVAAGKNQLLICHAFGRSFRWQTLCMWINKEKCG